MDRHNSLEGKFSILFLFFGKQVKALFIKLASELDNSCSMMMFTRAYENVAYSVVFVTFLEFFLNF